VFLQGISASLASLGFAILFHVRGYKLITAAFIGAMGGMTYYLSLSNDQSEVFALFVASFMISILSEIFARIHKCPVTTFLICALIPLVPGGGMYYTMLEVVRNHIDQAITLGVNTIIQACSIVIGCLTVSSCMRVIAQTRQKRHKKITT